MTPDCCIVGTGPAGAFLALRLARQGVSVTLLEAHIDFGRNFRGDPLQPAANVLFRVWSSTSQSAQSTWQTVQRQREWPVRIVQACQATTQRWLAACGSGGVPLPLRAPMRALAAHVFGLGVWPVRIQSAKAGMTSRAKSRIDSRLSSSVMSPHWSAGPK